MAGEEALANTGLKEASEAMVKATRFGVDPAILESAMETYAKASAEAAPIELYIKGAKQNLENAIKELADAVRQYSK